MQEDSDKQSAETTAARPDETDRGAGSDEDTASGVRRRDWIMSLAACLAIFTVAGLVLYYIFTNEPKATREGATKKSAMLVSVQTVRVGDYRPEVVATGTVMPAREIMLSPRVSGEVINDRSVTLTALVDGQVVSVEAALGDRVEAGQVLASMGNRASAANLRRARAYLQQLEVHRREAKLNHGRTQRLAEKGAVSQEQLEEAKLNWEAATAAWEVAEAGLRLAEVAQEWQAVRAPFAAVVVDKSTETGQWVEAGTKLFTLVALDNWEIEAHVDAVDSGRVQVGQPVAIRCDAFPGQVWQSSVKWIGPSVEREQERRLNTFRVRLGLGDEAPSLLLGQQRSL